MKHEKFDKQYIGKLNPRCTFYCKVCKRWYSGKMEDSKVNEPVYSAIQHENGVEDCVHYADIEITEEIYDKHMEILRDNDLLE